MGTTSGDARDVVVVSLEPYDEVWRRNQYLLDRIRRRNPGMRVLFVEPPVDAWRSRDLSAFRHRGPQAVSGEAGLWTLRPVKPLPRLLGPWSDLSLRRQMRRAASSRGSRALLIRFNDLQHVGPGASTGWASTGWPAVCDVTDDWVVETTTKPRERRRRLEPSASAKCRNGVVCSAGREASRGATRLNTLVPNGVDANLTATAHMRPGDLQPVAVAVGDLCEERSDVEPAGELLHELRD